MRQFDRTSQCPKCGSRSASSTWRPAVQTSPQDAGKTTIPLPVFGLLMNGEHIERKCTECGYRWPEETLDA